MGAMVPLIFQGSSLRMGSLSSTRRITRIGIYHYTEVKIPSHITVSFVPNSNNKPVVWLVQSNCTINGTISIKGGDITNMFGVRGGPGGYRGGNGSLDSQIPAGSGLGPGGGKVVGTNEFGGNASFGTLGNVNPWPSQNPEGELYGNSYLIPLIGGSGGGGGRNRLAGGAGGAGAILVVCSGTLSLQGGIDARGGGSPNLFDYPFYGGAGSGGAVRLVATSIEGSGFIDCGGGFVVRGYDGSSSRYYGTTGGKGRVRLDAMSDTFVGGINGESTRGFQPIIAPPPDHAIRLAIQSIAGIAVATSPGGLLTSPDVIIPAAQANPISIVVRCVNIQLNTEIIVEVKPANGPYVRGVGLNSQGTESNSTAIITLNMPRGGGTIQAKAISGIAETLGASLSNSQRYRSYAETGFTADGERFAKLEVTATLGGGQQLVYLTESGKRYPFHGK